MITLNYSFLKERAAELAHAIGVNARVYGIPNGGIPAALLFAAASPTSKIVEAPEDADIFIDDIIDSGATRSRYQEAYHKPFYALVDKLGKDKQWSGWVSFPWERVVKDSGVEDNIRRILQYIGEDVNREGLKETPARVSRSYAELFSGYKQNPADVMKVFEDGACDEMVVLKGVSFFSTCEHHLLPFHGVAHVAYIPRGRIIGLSKMARLVEIFARRLQVQERMTTQITTALMEGLRPMGAACIIEAQHLCMACRGVRQADSKMVTSSLLGVFKDAAPRAEFLQLIKE